MEARRELYAEAPSNAGAAAVTVNKDKTRIVSAGEGFDFLGVHFHKQSTPRGRQFCYCWPSRRSMQRVRDKVRTLIGRETGVPLSWLNAALHFPAAELVFDIFVNQPLRDKHQRRHRAL